MIDSLTSRALLLKEQGPIIRDGTITITQTNQPPEYKVPKKCGVSIWGEQQKVVHCPVHLLKRFW